MRVDETRTLDPVERFLYWCGERYRVHVRREAGEPRPWTDDTILQRYFFTNPYRELDKTTVWFAKHLRDTLSDPRQIIFATTCFRWFNYIPTGEVLIDSGLATRWDEQKAVAILGARRALGLQIFTGAFMVNSPGGERKLEAICRRVSNVWADLDRLEADARGWDTLQGAHRDLLRYEGLGGFMAYEIVCDLRHTPVLRYATDVRTWSNPGPGAIRGLYRILNIAIPGQGNASSPPRLKDWDAETARLLGLLSERYPSHPPVEMREVEHSLCEFDKYSRVLFGEGRAKRTFNGEGGLLL